MIRFRPGLAGLASVLTSLSSLPSNAADKDLVLPSVVVTATRQAQRVDELMSDVTVLEREQIERIGQGTVVDLLSRQPGIQTVQLGGAGTTTDFLVRGARSEQTKVLIDGIPVNSMDTKGSPLRTLSLADVDRIEILRGPASALYGSDASGGVIQVFTRKAGDGVHGELFAGTGSRNTNSSSASLSAASEMWTARFSGSRYQTDGFSSLLNGRNKDTDKDGYLNRSGSASLAFRPAPGHELSALFISTSGVLHSDSASTNAKSNSYDYHTDFHNEVAGITSRDQITPDWLSTLRYGVNVQDDTSYSRNTTGPSGTVVASSLRTENHTFSWQNDIGLALGKGLVLVERQDQHAAPANRFPGQRDVTLDSWMLGWNASLGDHRWQINGRHDDHSRFGDKNTGSATYGYQFAPGWRGHVAAATSFRAPTMYQLYASIPGSLNPNPNLQPETGRNYEASLTHDWGIHSLSLTTYRNRMRNLIDYSGTTLRYENISAATFKGWTLAYQGNIAGWAVATNLDIQDAEDDSTGMPLQRRAREKFGATLDRNWGSWDTGLELVAMGRRYDTNVRTLPEGGYSVVNLTARYAINRDLSLELRGDNIADRRYINAYSSGGTFTYNVPGASYFAGLRYRL